MSCLKNFIMTTIKKLNQKLITHDGSFHTDDIFAAATLSIYLEKKGETFEIIRTRNEEIIKNGDYVFDVGGFYDEEKNRFDHHQVNGAGKRDNGIEYASFGLVWKKFGGELCNGETEAELIDQKLVQPIDAGDNGVNLVELKREVIPYFIQYAFNAFRPGWKDVSEKALFVGFLECVQMAKNILTREIGRARDITEAQKIISNQFLWFILELTIRGGLKEWRQVNFPLKREKNFQIPGRDLEMESYRKSPKFPMPYSAIADFLWLLLNQKKALSNWRKLR